MDGPGRALRSAKQFELHSVGNGETLKECKQVDKMTRSAFEGSHSENIVNEGLEEVRP